MGSAFVIIDNNYNVWPALYSPSIYMLMLAFIPTKFNFILSILQTTACAL